MTVTIVAPTSVALTQSTKLINKQIPFVMNLDLILKSTGQAQGTKIYGNEPGS